MQPPDLQTLASRSLTLTIPISYTNALPGINLTDCTPLQLTHLLTLGFRRLILTLAYPAGASDWATPSGTSLSSLSTTLSTYLHTTQTTLTASLIYLTLHLQGGPPSAEGSLEPLGEYIYTPRTLRAERHNLNGARSWFGARADVRPERGYFTITEEGSGLQTENGWPTEGFVLLQHRRRVVVDITRDGDVGSSDDSDDFFAGETIHMVQPGECFDASTAWPGRGNNTFAAAAVDGAGEVAGVMNCGIAPILAPSASSGEYEAFIDASRFPFSGDEPEEGRCAVVDTSTGKWHAKSCEERYRPACRVNGGAYTWTIPAREGSYSQSQDICGGNNKFAAPRTPLENRHLINSTATKGYVWVDFNSLGEEECWIVGRDTKCPFTQTGHEGERRVVVPIVSAVVVFVVAALMLCVKSRRSRKSKRRRRKGGDRIEYEGVPA
ncbi:hypothetical protein K470DRAFT_255584 [Piedraia hortae CBS 480.64]|uniref:Maintenance of telomere capping protein 6 n=1 Tax=Piedraia hortae CBS 480.64 TaxID=1314780 RepID=A0A6A7C5Y3_9PEZI|nr:hypothetical protein K470DRAFT_255584 [Piedraia hortae CBS 480.64]